MVQDMINPQEQLAIVDELTSPAQIFDFCESELFPEALQQNNSEVASNSNCCYEDQSSYPTNISSTPEMNNNKYSSRLENFETKPTITNTTITSNPNPNDSNNNNNNIDSSNNNDNNFSLIFDSRGEIENDICGAIDFNPSSNNYTIPPQQFINQQEQFDISSLNNPINVTQDIVMAGASSLDHQFNSMPPDPPVVPLMVPQLPPVYEDECLSSVPSSYMRNLNSSMPHCSLLDPSLGSYMPNALSMDNSGIMAGAGLFFGPELAHHESDYHGDSTGFFCPDNMHRVFNCTNDLQALSNENQHLMKGRSSSSPLTPEISNLDDSAFKVGKLSVEEKKEKIHRYMKKRNERNFSKKIKYACRKTLADSRPRVRGRFAKNDELVEAARAALMHHEEDTDEECRQMVAVKEEEDMVDTSDIFAHLNGVNSFKCNNSINPIQSWI
ncbi:hypothetical protein Leryth_003726 [Lithospermum erythrorhizon]|uniref:CCT domain-containing protein n=1 Tax=Lithospermum erythrorhizon TaxID=34254 RepID=A0AAV3NY51_LITER|nr:hypothetical protein Leryth_003726 [Lithospermum erythrorhizon]